MSWSSWVQIHTRIYKHASGTQGHPPLALEMHGPSKGRAMNIKMNTVGTKQTTAAGIAALAIALSAGSAVAANPDKHTKRSHTQSKHMQSGQAQDATAWISLVPADTLMGTEVIGSDNNTVGTINDFVVDRGTGRIAYAIIGHGGILSLGQDVFAVEYDRLKYFPTNENFEVNMTKTQAERQVEFLPENWKDLNHSSWMSELKDFVSSEDTYRYGDSELKDRDIRSINGTVTKLERKDYENTDDVVLTVQGEDGNSTKVILGPSWYVMGHDNAPSVNDRVELKAFKHDGRMVATNARIANKELKLRDTQGNVSWKTQSKNAPRYVMLSDLTGRNIEIGGTTGGEVNDTIVETSSGRVAFFAFDPNDNLFGIADDISLVPWGAIQLSSDMTLWSDMEDSQFEHARPMPEDLSTMRTQRSLDSVYNSFGMSTPVFESSDRSTTNRDHRESARDRTGEAWSESSMLTEAFADGETRTIKGDFIKTDSIKLHNGAITASTIWINTDDGKQQVILGPNWYIENQDLDLNWSETVTVTGREATIDGETYIAAWDIQGESTTWTLWNDTTPAWVD